MVLPSGTRPQQDVGVYFPGQSTYFRIHDRKIRAYQKAPYNLSLSYYRHHGTFESTPLLSPPFNYYGGPPCHAGTIRNFNFSTARRQLAINAAYERLKGKLYDSASLGVDFVEYRQSLSMMTRSVTDLVKFTLQLKKFDFVGAARTLKMHFVPPGVSKRKSLANNWLEYHFGWEPLVHDVYDSVEVLNNPVKAFTRSKGARRETFTDVSVVNYGQYTSSMRIVSSYLIVEGASVRALTDRGLHALDQFGVINPAVLAWELVPFSFVVDWFTNVGQVLSSFSDFAGMTLDQPFTTETYTVSLVGSNRLNLGATPTPGYKNLEYYGTGMYMQRSAGLTGPSLSVKRLRLPSKARAATALSLLTQLMGK